MTMAEYIRLVAQIAVLKEVAMEYKKNVRKSQFIEQHEK